MTLIELNSRTSAHFSHDKLMYEKVFLVSAKHSKWCNDNNKTINLL